MYIFLQTYKSSSAPSSIINDSILTLIWFISISSGDCWGIEADVTDMEGGVGEWVLEWVRKAIKRFFSHYFITLAF